MAVDIAEIRRERLREHARALGGPARLADKLDRSQSQISQIIGRNPTRNIGRYQAREIEQKLGLPKYALDRTADVAHGNVREQLIAELVHELTPGQQDELLKRLRAVVDENRTRGKLLGSASTDALGLQ